MAEISTWDELISNSDTEAEIVWTGGDLDFNSIKSEGFTETINFTAKSIDFSGATFKNIRSYAAIALDFSFANKESFLKNLNIIDMVHNPVVNSNNHLCRVHVTKVENFTVTAVAIPSMGYSIFTATASGSSSAISVRCFSCGFNVQAVSNDYKVYFDKDTYIKSFIFTDCRFIFDITQNGTVMFNDSVSIVNCLISGRFKNIDETAVSLTSSNFTGTNVYNLEGSFTYTSPKLSVYNSDLATVDTNGTGYIEGVTTDELKNPEILREKGFPIAVVGT